MVLFHLTLYRLIDLSHLEQISGVHVYKVIPPPHLHSFKEGFLCMCQ